MPNAWRAASQTGSTSAKPGSPRPGVASAVWSGLRAASAASLQALLQHQVAAAVKPNRQVVSELQPSPLDGLRAAVAVADPTDRIVVFGSFYTVGGVLHNGTPRLRGKHLE